VENGGNCRPFIAPVDVQLDCDEKTMVQPSINQLNPLFIRQGTVIIYSITSVPLISVVYMLSYLTNLSGVPLGTVQKIFSGETVNPRYDTLLALEHFFSSTLCSSGKVR